MRTPVFFEMTEIIEIAGNYNRPKSVFAIRTQSTEKHIYRAFPDCASTPAKSRQH
jgi:hypothetical protein